MKTLCILRHAKSGKKDNPDLHDHDRPLNKRGEQQAPIMGHKFREQGITPELIVSSTAKRALSTARAVAQGLEYDKDKIRQEGELYLADHLFLARWVAGLPDDTNNVMIVGHNPGSTDLVDHFTGAGIGNIPTCGLAVVEFSAGSWQEVIRDSGILVHFDYPKRYPEMQ